MNTVDLNKNSAAGADRAADLLTDVDISLTTRFRLAALAPVGIIGDGIPLVNDERTKSEPLKVGLDHLLG